jgi:hypothetical protein
MFVGHLVSRYMSRQWEFDADRYQARLAGSDMVGPTLQRLMLLSVAHNGARADLAEFYSEGRLADNLPRLIMANIEHITPEMAERVRKLQDEEASGWFDTHPAYKDRVASARQEQAPGMFHLECPASVLFSNSDALSRDVTWDLYRHIFGPQFKASEMHPVDDLLARQGTEIEAGKALDRFFPGRFHSLRPPLLHDTYLAPPDDPRQVLAQLKQARRQMLDAAAAYSRDCRLFVEADKAGIEAAQAAALLATGFKISRKEFSTPIRDEDAARHALADTLRQQRQLAESMQPYERAAGQRIFAALTLLHAPQVAAKIEDAKQAQQRSAQLLSALSALIGQYRILFELRNAHATQAALLSRLDGNEENQRLIKALLKRTASVANHLRQLRTTFARHRYPFDHAKGETTIGNYLVEALPSNDQLPEALQTSETLLERLPSLYCRILGRLVTVVENVEKALGLDPLPKPPPREEQQADEP